METFKLIQTYNTFCVNGTADPLKASAGFETVRELLTYMKSSYEFHKKYDYTIYTDDGGYDIVRNVIPQECIEVIQFECIDDRFPFMGKFDAYKRQKNNFLHADLDSTVFEMPETDAHIVCEKVRSIGFGRELKWANYSREDRAGISSIPCSGLLGFTDMNLKDLYVERTIQKVKSLRKSHVVNHKVHYTVEETGLQMIARDLGSSIYELPPESFEHLQGGLKNISK